MTRKEKLFQRLVNSQKNVKFGDFTAVIESFGFELDRTKGSHRVYKHPGVDNAFLVIQPDKNNQALPYQVKQLLALIEEYGLSMNGETDADDEQDEDSDL